MPLPRQPPTSGPMSAYGAGVAGWQGEYSGRDQGELSCFLGREGGADRYEGEVIGAQVLFRAFCGLVLGGHRAISMR